MFSTRRTRVGGELSSSETVSGRLRKYLLFLDVMALSVRGNGLAKTKFVLKNMKEFFGKLVNEKRKFSLQVVATSEHSSRSDSDPKEPQVKGIFLFLCFLIVVVPLHVSEVFCPKKLARISRSSFLQSPIRSPSGTKYICFCMIEICSPMGIIAGRARCF